MQISREEIQKRLIELVKEILEDESIEIDPGKSLIGDYGLDSLDLLDFSFNIEEIFNVKIGKDELSGRGRSTLKKEEMLDENGCTSEKALEELRRNVPEIPPEKFRYGMKQGDIPRLLNVAVFTRFVYDKLAGAAI